MGLVGFYKISVCDIGLCIHVIIIAVFFLSLFNCCKSDDFGSVNVEYFLCDYICCYIFSVLYVY